ncbi:MAG: cytochrome c [Cyanobacteria bacterium J083]|nr:MAG: cytochrome c [Cyanobacteria bacterium J083]
MNNHLTQTPKYIPWVIGLTLSVLMILFASVISFYFTVQVGDPYIKEVLALTGDKTKGKAIFQINCAGCHGAKADGNVGPSLQDVSKRKSKVKLIKQVISGKTPPMPKFQPDPQAMADLLSYLEQL